jgi:hypothetical protein
MLDLIDSLDILTFLAAGLFVFFGSLALSPSVHKE